MTPTKTRSTGDTPDMIHPVVFSHPATETRAVPRQLRGTPFPHFESSTSPGR